MVKENTHTHTRTHTLFSNLKPFIIYTDCSSCTLGRIAGRPVVHIKLPKLNKSAKKEILSDILGL